MKVIIENLLNKLSKNVLITLVIFFAGISVTLWYQYSDYSPKSIRKGQDEIINFTMSQAKMSFLRDSTLKASIDEVKTDQYLMRAQIDTIVNYQTPALITRVNMMATFYRQLSKDIKPEPEKLLLDIQPIKPKYEQTISLINDLKLSIKPDTIKKNVN